MRLHLHGILYHATATALALAELAVAEQIVNIEFMEAVCGFWRDKNCQKSILAFNSILY